ncbi:hypothetical protein [Bdellovibrio svalbardensis]|uniref:Uncharacterized protein n=1 Tax=Bdellovibrio svalbardensis TaxID=2972972 RepID=A0ABT6DQ35_9BACT|nr:hypothetical protein [Bdellovibrio svalbardensis]MDG0818165.1 hypothetical protein [Bdellovibrio svalbardensis]
MKTLVKTSFLGLMLVGSLAKSATHREAAAICESMSFSSSKKVCLAYIITVKEAYFDNGAIGICKNMSFDSGKNECVRNITSKAYESYEISAIDGMSFDSEKNQALSAGGELVSMNPNPGYPAPLPPPPPPQYPDYSNSGDYINGQTAAWKNAGVFTVSKGLIESYEINLDGTRGVTEVRLAAKNAAVRITKAYAITASGQYLELPSLQGDVGAQGVKSVRLDSRYAIRLQRLVIEATSPQLIGSRGQLEVVVGTTR